MQDNADVGGEAKRRESGVGGGNETHLLQQEAGETTDGVPPKIARVLRGGLSWRQS